MLQLSDTVEWQALEKQYQLTLGLSLSQLFATDPKRFQNYSIEFNGLLLDYSKNLITAASFDTLIQLAKRAELTTGIEALFSGHKLNTTEDRPVLHSALRSSDSAPLMVDGDNVHESIAQNFQNMANLVLKLRSGTWLGATGQRLQDIVHIGIGGSHLGPECILAALGGAQECAPKVHFVSTVDGHQLRQCLQQLDPERTLLVVASKSFSTEETLVNARHAKQWLLQGLPANAKIQNHLVGISANTQAAQDFGIPAQQILEFSSWVGGRYSVWSAVSFSVAAAVGMDRFKQFLQGAQKMDQHFRTAELSQNMPVVLALLGIWYNNFFGIHSHLILPYDWALRLVPDYIQQCDMESNGKRVDKSGMVLQHASGPVIWGKSAVDAQHAFFQRLHQGNEFVPCDLIVAAEPQFETDNHQLLLANFVAQSRALMLGRDEAQAAAEISHLDLSSERRANLISAKLCPGNRPSNSLLLKEVCAESLGMLLALYEHKIFVQGYIWRINSFDQMGVELGKKIAKDVLVDIVDAKPCSRLDSSSNGLINQYKNYHRK